MAACDDNDPWPDLRPSFFAARPALTPLLVIPDLLVSAMVGPEDVDALLNTVDCLSSNWTRLLTSVPSSSQIKTWLQMKQSRSTMFSRKPIFISIN